MNKIERYVQLILIFYLKNVVKLDAFNKGVRYEKDSGGNIVR